METLIITPRGVCSQRMTIEYEDGIIKHASVYGGCHGNLQGICKLIEGLKIEDVISKLKGIDCHGRGTSCPDQMARGLEQLVK